MTGVCPRFQQREPKAQPQAAKAALRSLSTLSPGFLGGVLDVAPRVALA